MLDPRLLRSFVAVVDGNGFSTAARRLNATQSALSARIKALEQQVGRVLLTRSTKSGVSLTAEGQLLLDAARGILHRLDRLEHELRQDPLTGTARIGMTDDFVTGPDLVRVLGDFAHLHDEVTLDVLIDRKDRLLTMIEGNHLDIAMIRQIEPTAAETLLRRDRIAWVARCDYELDLSRPVPLICASAPCDVRAAAVRSLEGAGVAWRHALSSLSLAAQMSAVEAGLGIAPLTAELIRPGLKEIDGLPSPGSVHLVLLRRVGDSKIRAALGDLVLRAFRDHQTTSSALSSA